MLHLHSYWHPNTTIKITKFIYIQKERGMKAKHSFSFSFLLFQTCPKSLWWKGSLRWTPNNISFLPGMTSTKTIPAIGKILLVAKASQQRNIWSLKILSWNFISRTNNTVQTKRPLFFFPKSRNIFWSNNEHPIIQMKKGDWSCPFFFQNLLKHLWVKMYTWWKQWAQKMNGKSQLRILSSWKKLNPVEIASRSRVHEAATKTLSILGKWSWKRMVWSDANLKCKKNNRKQGQ